ncbi:MAG: TolC family protein [Terrimicrobiaceae bacterium]
MTSILKYFLPAAAVMFWLVSSSHGADGQIEVGFDNIARLVSERNREIHAMRQLVSEAQGRLRASGRLSNPELETEMAGGQDFEGRLSVGFHQRFPVTSRLRLERQLSGLEVEAARLEVRQRERELETAARLAFVDWVTAKEARAVELRQAEAAREFAKSLEGASGSGLVSQMDSEQAAFEAETRAVAAQALEIPEIEAHGRLCTLLGVPEGTELSFRGGLELPAKAPAARPPAGRPDLALAEMAVQAGATEVSLARASAWEDVMVGLFAEGERFRDEPEGLEPEALLGIRFSVPLPLWQSVGGRVAEKEAALHRKEGQVDALRLAVANEVASAHRVMSGHLRIASGMKKKLLPSAHKQLAGAEDACRRGEVGVQAVFRARDAVIEAEKSALAARRNYFQSHTLWLAALGDPAEKP